MDDQTLQRRFPYYLTGLFVGIALVIVILSVKQAMAPKFEEKEETYEPISIKASGRVSIKFPKNPIDFLAPTAKSTIFLGKETEPGKYQPIQRVQHGQIEENKLAFGPLAQGNYELRFILFYCIEGTEKKMQCFKHIINQKVLAQENGPLEQIMNVKTF